MDFSKCNIGLGITGSFCMFSRARKEIERLTELGANVHFTELDFTAEMIAVL